MKIEQMVNGSPKQKINENINETRNRKIAWYHLLIRKFNSTQNKCYTVCRTHSIIKIFSNYNQTSINHLDIIINITTIITKKYWWHCAFLDRSIEIQRLKKYSINTEKILIQKKRQKEKLFCDESVLAERLMWQQNHAKKTSDQTLTAI